MRVINTRKHFSNSSKWFSNKSELGTGVFYIS